MKKSVILLTLLTLLITACGVSSPTHITGVPYTNSSIGISLEYPTGWAYTERTDFLSPFYEIMLVSDQTVSGPPIESGAAMGILNNYQLAVPLPDGVSTPDKALEYIMGKQFQDFAVVKAPHAYSIDSFPAASGIYSTTYESGPLQIGYFTTILRGEEVLIFIGFCPQHEWKRHRPKFDFILNSLDLKYNR